MEPYHLNLVGFRYEVKIKKKTACIRDIAADIKARFLMRGRVQCGALPFRAVWLGVQMAKYSPNSRPYP